MILRSCVGNIQSLSYEWTKIKLTGNHPLIKVLFYCKIGWEGNGRDCTNIDECAVGTHTCGSNADCGNDATETYSCSCHPGFTDVGTADGTQCQG